MFLNFSEFFEYFRIFRIFPNCSNILNTSEFFEFEEVPQRRRTTFRRIGPRFSKLSRSMRLFPDFFVLDFEWIWLSTTINHDLRKLSTRHFQRHHRSSAPKKKSLSPLSWLLLWLLQKLHPPTLFLYRFFFFSSLTIGNISSSFFSRMAMAAIFLLKRAGDFFFAYRKSFFGTQISSCQSTLCISKARDLMERHRNSPILLTLWWILKKIRVSRKGTFHIWVGTSQLVKFALSFLHHNS